MKATSRTERRTQAPRLPDMTSAGSKAALEQYFDSLEARLNDALDRIAALESRVATLEAAP